MIYIFKLGDGSHSEEVGAGDSIAVQTGDDTSLRALSPFDESDRSTTTADEISTEVVLNLWCICCAKYHICMCLNFFFFYLTLFTMS